MTAILVTHNGAPVALVGPRRTDLVGKLPSLPAGHPDARFALHKIAYAQLVSAGELPGPYQDDTAERFARAALIDPLELVLHMDRADHEIAELMRVPAGQVKRARDELERKGGSQ